MTWKKIIFLLIFALCLTVLDVSFFAALSVSGATFISSLAVVMIYALLRKEGDYLALGIFLTLFYSVFSSVPVWFIVITFVGIPSLVIFLRNSYFPEPSGIFAFLFFLLYYLIFEFVLLLIFKELNSEGGRILVYFILLNSITSIIIYQTVRLVRKKFRIEEIKI